MGISELDRSCLRDRTRGLFMFEQDLFPIGFFLLRSMQNFELQIFQLLESERGFLPFRKAPESR